jgi:hypothetical protein
MLKEIIVTINIKDLKKLKVASPDHPIYNGKYQVYPVNSLEDYKKQREEKEGLKNIFLEKLDPQKSKKERVQQLISILKKNGWKLVKKEGK